MLSSAHSLSCINRRADRKLSVVFGLDYSFKANEMTLIHRSEAALSYCERCVSSFGSVAIGVGHKTVLKIQASRVIGSVSAHRGYGVSVSRNRKESCVGKHHKLLNLVGLLIVKTRDESES